MLAAEQVPVLALIQPASSASCWRQASCRRPASRTQPETSARGWDGLTERINLDLLRECVGDLQAPMYYVAGPHRIIVAVTEALTVAGVDLARLKKDEFTGY